MVLDMIELRHETYKKTIKLNTSAKTVKIEYFPQKSNQLRNLTTKIQLTLSKRGHNQERKEALRFKIFNLI